MNFEIYSDFGCINLALVDFLQALWKIYLNVKINSYVFLDLKIDFCKTYSKGGARRGSNLNEVSK